MEIKFQELLILIYLNEYKDTYLLSEIKLICNFSTEQLKLFLQNMEEKGLIENSNKLISMTFIGKTVLEEKGLEVVVIDDLLKDKVTLEIEDDPLGFNDVYIPMKFTN